MSKTDPDRYEEPLATPNRMSMREGDPMLEIRRDDAEKIVDLICTNAVSIVSHEARSGSTTLMDSLVKRILTQEKGYFVPDDRFGPFPDLAVEIRKEISKKPEKETGMDSGAVIIVDEAGGLPGLDWTAKSDEEKADVVDLKDGLKSIMEGALGNVRLVFTCHEGGVDDLQRWLQNILGAKEPIASLQIESFSREDLLKMFTMMIANNEVHPDLLGREKEVIDEVHSPQQLTYLVHQYGEIRQEGSDHETAWERCKTPNETLYNAINSSVLTSGGAPLIKLIQRISSSELKSEDLAEDERSVLERCRAFHFFETDKDGVLKVRGAMVERTVNTFSPGYIQKLEAEEIAIRQRQTTETGPEKKPDERTQILEGLVSFFSIYTNKQQASVRAEKYYEALESRCGKMGVELAKEIIKLRDHDLSYDRLSPEQRQTVDKNSDLFKVDRSYYKLPVMLNSDFRE